MDIDQIRFKQAIACFNSGQFYECHDILEHHCWQAKSSYPSHQFIQGLIQLAVAFHHHFQANKTGYQRLLNKAHHNILASQNSPAAQWVDTSVLLDHLQALNEDSAQIKNSPLLTSGLSILL